MSYFFPFAIWIIATVIFLCLVFFRHRMLGRQHYRLLSVLYTGIFLIAFFRFSLAFTMASSREGRAIAEGVEAARIYFEGQGNLMTLLMVSVTMWAIAYSEYRNRNVSGISPPNNKGHGK